MSGKLFLCATPIGNLGDITYRTIETLQFVDLIAAEDTRRTVKLLNHFDIHKPMTSYYEHNRREKGEYLISLMEEGKNIALVSDAGTPAVSDPGEDLVKLCIEHGITVTSVPGAVAGITALICSGMDTGRFAFEGFLTTNRQNRQTHLEEIKNDRRTLLFYEAPHKLLATLKDMYSVLGERRICLCREMTKVHEEFFRTTLSEAIAHYTENVPRGEFVLVLEGAKEEKTDYTAISIKDHVALYLAQGHDEKQAMKLAAKDRGVSKSEIYAAYKLSK